VIQDFCASVVKMRQRKWLPRSFILGLLLLIVFAFWLYDSAWTWLVCLLAIGVALHSICRSLPPLDPRSFGVGSDLWVQYREREHVRLMWMSATVRVFEVRLLRLLERRRRLAKQAEATQRHQNGTHAPASASKVSLEPPCSLRDGPPVREEEALPKKKHVGQRRLMRQRRPVSDSSKCEGKQPLSESHREEQLCRITGGEETESPPHAVDAIRIDARPTVPIEALQVAEERVGSRRADLLREEVEADEADECFNEDGGDEIDAEFARRVQEHFQNRVQAAGKDLHSQTERGNQILKSLCEKLKTELERASAPS